MSRLTSTLMIPALAATLLASGCSMATTSGQPDTLVMHRVIVDGTPVAAENQSVLELLLARARFRLGTTEYDAPLVVLDGMPIINGMNRLNTIPVTDVQRVTFLRSLDAHLRYGSGGRNGAILIETVKGATFR